MLPFRATVGAAAGAPATVNQIPNSGRPTGSDGTALCRRRVTAT
jgi:hypothetical protein